MQPMTHATSTIGPVPALFGRDDELGLLRRHLQAARDGQGSLALIAGEAGIGKSALSATICQAAATDGALVLTGGCYDLTTTPPYGPWAEIIARFPDDNQFPPLPAQLRPGGGLAGIDSQAALFDATLRFLTAVAAIRPLTVLLEDIHWSDTASLDFLRYVSRSIPRAPILLLATYRDDEITHDHPLAALLPALVREGPVHRLHLGRLEPPAVLSLVRECYLLPAEEEARLAAYLLRQAEGNPFFTRELLHSLNEQRLLRPMAGGWELGELDQSSVPTLVQQVIDGRLTRLDGSARALLEHAAVIGFDSPLDVLQELHRDTRQELDDALQGAIRHHLLTVGPSHRSAHFTHALVRQAIYQSIPPLRRQSLHLRVGELLAARARADPATVANHFYEAGDTRGLEWLLRAARLAQRLFAPDTVMAECGRAIALASDLERDVPASVYRLRGWAWDSTGDFERALHDYDQALALARATADMHEQLQSLLDLGALWASRDYQKTGDYCRQAVELARSMDDPAALGHSLNRLGNWHANAEQPTEALRCHHEALEIFETIADRRGEASTLDLVAMAYGLIGDATQSLRNYERAIPLLRQLDDRQTLSSALATTNAFSYGAWSTCTLGVQGVPASLGSDPGEMAEEAIRLAREIGWRSGEGYATAQAGATLVRRGILRAGYQYLSEAHDIAERIQHRHWLAQAHVNIASTYVDLLLPSLARRHLEPGLSYAIATGSSFFRTSATGLLATALIQDGDDLAAERLLQGEIDPARAPRLFSEGTCWYAHTLLLLVRGQDERALQAVDLVIASIPVGSASLPPEWLRLRGEILLACGRLDEAEASLNDALTVTTTHRLALIHWRVLASLQRLYLRAGRRDEATAAREAALALVNDIADQFDDGEIRDAFLSAARARLDGPHPAETTDQPASSNVAGLTARELEVLRYLVEGRSDREIADTLSVSHRTVSHHVSNILGKLYVSSRTAAVTVAIREGLVRP
jgi:DNA-binding CsgD family transcriptional regulator